MYIHLDSRETALIEACKIYRSGRDSLDHIEFKIESLPLGDIIIKDRDGNEKLIVERKTVRDLASSIQDNRYREQSFRLDQCELDNHNIYYVIEGSYSSLGSRFDRKTILSAITTLSYYKGFSVHRTFNIGETAEWLLRTADKISRETKTPYYAEHPGQQSSAVGENSYSSVSKRVKKNNVTIGNIGEIMLMQIPDVSAHAAQCILSHYKSIKNIIRVLEVNPKALDTLRLKTKTGKDRSLNCTTRINIYNYLVSNDNKIISVETE